MKVRILDTDNNRTDGWFVTSGFKPGQVFNVIKKDATYYWVNVNSNVVGLFKDRVQVVK